MVHPILVILAVINQTTRHRWPAFCGRCIKCGWYYCCTSQTRLLYSYGNCTRTRTLACVRQRLGTLENVSAHARAQEWEINCSHDLHTFYEFNKFIVYIFVRAW